MVPELFTTGNCIACVSWKGNPVEKSGAANNSSLRLRLLSDNSNWFACKVNSEKLANPSCASVNELK